jgi:hypothetical protein
MRRTSTPRCEADGHANARPQSHPVWLRAEVSWVPDVDHLLGAGLLVLAHPPAGPVVPTSAELRRARRRRYREAARAQRLAARAGEPVTVRDGEGPSMAASSEPLPFGLYTIGDSTFTEEARRSDGGPLPADTRRLFPLPSP